MEHFLVYSQNDLMFSYFPLLCPFSISETAHYFFVCHASFSNMPVSHKTFLRNVLKNFKKDD